MAFLVSGTSFAQTSSERAAVQLTATVQSSPARITINWTSMSSTSSITIYRKTLAANTWGSAHATVASSATQYQDNSVTVGTAYEYRVVRVAGGVTGNGYIATGIAVPAVDYRGKMILLVDNTVAAPLTNEIQQLERDLRADGWAVVRSDVSRTASVTSIRNIVVGHYNSDPTNVKALFLLGHVPVPYSGNQAPDGHSEHTGAWPCDGYYGELNGTWTDNTVNNSAAQRAENRNVLGDGKFDQTQFPSDLELQVGRVDMYDMPAFGQSEVELLRAYLNKVHSFKVKGFTPQERGLVFDNLQWVSNPLAASAWRNLPPLVGASNITTAYPYGEPFHTYVNGQSYLWTYSSGGGSQAYVGSTLTFNGANNVATTETLAGGVQMNGVFNMSFGSYFGDWDNKNNFLRAPLASGQALTNCWAAIPAWYFHHMGMGQNIGYSVQRTMNNASLYTPLTDGWQGSIGRVHLALMGDPSLRMQMVAPPTNLSVTNVSGTASFTWNASAEASAGYYLYSIDAATGVATRLVSSAITATSYQSGTIPYVQGRQYMVRAVKLRVNQSGSFYDLSLGALATASGSGSAVVDCAGVAGGSALPGTACNDGNACTTNDVYNANCQCTGTAVSSTVSITAGGSTSFCTGGSVVLSATTGTGSTYAWYRNGTIISGATAANYTATLAGSYTVQRTVSGCSATSSAVTVTVGSAPTVAISAGGATTFCSGGSVVLIATTGTGSTYVWYRNGAVVSGATSSSYTATLAGSYTVRRTVSGCAATSSAVTVTVTAGPSVSLTAGGATTFCSGGSVVLNATTGTGSTYVWYRNGAVVSGATAASYTATLTGSYTVQRTVSGCSGTSSALMVTVTAGPSVSITAGGPTAFCTGGSVVLNATTGTGSTYTWYRDGSTISGATASSYTATLAGSYTVRRTLSGCSATSSAVAVTLGTAPATTITPNGPTNFNSGGSVALYATWTSGSTFIWYRNGTAITGSTASNTITATTGGSYTVVRTISGCSSTSPAVVVVVGSGSAVTITPNGPTSFCTGANVVLTASTVSGATYQWRRNGTNITGATSSSYTASLAGGYTVVRTVSGTSSTSSQVTVTVSALPVLSMSASPANGTVSVSASGGTVPYTYAWSTTPAQTTATANVTASGTYNVSVTTAAGCRSNGSVSITLPTNIVCTGIRAESQGSWGAVSNGYDPAAYMNSNFAAAFPASTYLTIGCGTRLMRLTTASAVGAFLPTYGSVAMLPSGTLTNPGSAYSNTLAGELIALKLSIRFDEINSAFSPASALLKNMVISSGAFAGWTVQQLVNQADQAIGGCSSAYGINTLNGALMTINLNYYQGSAGNGFLTCPASGMQMEVPAEEAADLLLENALEVSVFPNPVMDAATMVVTGLMENEALSVTLVSLDGRTVSTVQENVVMEASELRLPLNVQGLAPGVYLYQVIQGDRTKAGRIVVQ